MKEEINSGGAVSGDKGSQGSPPPPKVSLGRWGTIILVAVLALAVGVYWGRGQSRSGSTAGRAAAPGAGEHQHGQAAVGGKEAIQYYTCGMHPWVILPAPGNCPICHMALVPLEAGKLSGGVAINPVITQDIGVRIAPVTSGPLTRTIRTVGTVDYNETALRDVSLKIGGWVEKLYVDYVGQKVRKDQPLLEIYAPELFSAQAEYLQAFKSGSAGGGSVGGEMLESSRARLENYGVSPEQIRQLEQSGKPTRTMTLTSPFEGLVVIRNVYEGAKVEPGAQLLRIADLSTVWVMVAMYEYQIPFVQLGQEAMMNLTYIPGQVFHGKVAYIYPFLNPELRQLKVRLDFENPGLFLKPGMFANVELRGTLARDRTLVPREAVIDTGQRQVAFVSLGQGRFEPRPVKLGAEAEGGIVEVIEGLSPGEMVVVSANFLLDSEARLREALAKMVQGNQAATQPTQAAPLPPRPEAAETGKLSSEANELLADLMTNYFAIGDKLAGDTTQGAAEPAKRIAADMDKLLSVPMGDEHFWHRHGEAAEIRGKALELAQGGDIEAARQAFGDLSTALSKLLRATGVPASISREVQELHCPMFRPGQGGTIWLQPVGEVRNPYFGSVMLGCYDRKEALPRAASATGAATAPASQTASAPSMPMPMNYH